MKLNIKEKFKQEADEMGIFFGGAAQFAKSEQGKNAIKDVVKSTKELLHNMDVNQ